RANAGAAYALLTLLPPTSAAASEVVCRDIIVLLDTSGSMSGRPLAQAVQIVTGLVEALDDRDRLELIAFGSSPIRWSRQPVAAETAQRAKAMAWLRSLRAAGGTEMLAGIVEALRPLRGDAQRQVVLVTDGLIGFENEVVGAICRSLPRES